MAFKCFACGYDHVCTYEQKCFVSGRSDCGLLVHECENCRYGEYDGTGWINCTMPGQDIRKKLIPEHETEIFKTSFPEYIPDPDFPF